jgi:hypothetical protein
MVSMFSFSMPENRKGMDDEVRGRMNKRER